MVSTEPIIERLNRQERIQHMVMLLAFTTLTITGFLVFLPERYVTFIGTPAESFFQWRGYIHRFAGLLTVLVSIYHIGYIIFTERGRWCLRELLPCKRDLTDLWQMMQHFLDPKKPIPRFGWYNYV